MADEALFIGWGEVARGRERKALEVFNESLEYYGRLQQEGKIDSVEAYFLAPHGGDLQGFILLRGERAKLDEVEATAEFERIQTRAACRRPDWRGARFHRRRRRPPGGSLPGGGQRHRVLASPGPGEVELVLGQ